MTERKKPNNKRLILMIVLLAVVIALMWLLPDGSQPAAPATDAPKTEQTKNTNDTPDDIEATTLVKAGTQAPDFRVEMFDGTTFTLGSLRGKVVLLNFWATWCGPCREELSRVQKDIIDRFKGNEDFVFLPVSRGETRETVAAFREKMGYTFPMGLDPEQKIYRLYASNYIPRNFVIDRNGKVVLASVRVRPRRVRRNDQNHRKNTRITMDTKTILNEASGRMQKAIDHLEEELLNVRAGKASPNALNGIMVDYFGSQVPVSGAASVTVPDAKTILIQPWDKKMIKALEKAIIDSNIGLTPSNNGEQILLTIPPLTEERRKELVKQIRNEPKRPASACAMPAATRSRHSRKPRKRVCPRMSRRTAKPSRRSCWKNSLSCSTKRS